MEDATLLSRWLFGFTVTFHYLFAQLTLGLAPAIVFFQVLHLRSGDERHAGAARYWAKVFGLAFGLGVATGIPLEFEFGTNWAEFSRRTGDVIGHPLAMEGLYSFFLESTFLGLFFLGEQRIGRTLHFAATLALWAGAWLSGYLIIVVHAFMQRPVGARVDEDGVLRIESLGALLRNDWALWEFAHVIAGALVTGSVVIAAAAAFYTLVERHREQARSWLRFAVPVGLFAALFLAWPSGDRQAQLVARHQPATFAAMEAVFDTEAGVPLVLIGQPDVEQRRIDNPIPIPKLLSFLTFQRWEAVIQGLDAFPADEWPDSVPLVYFCYHVMVGLGTIFIAMFALAAWKLLRGSLLESRATLWLLMLALPFPFIANTAGWFTAEFGRQPWLVHGWIRTADGASANVSGGNVLFTLIGFCGVYAVLALLFVFLAGRIVARGPGDSPIGGE